MKPCPLELIMSGSDESRKPTTSVGVLGNKRKTPFEATFSEFLSSTPIIRAGASTSTRRVRSIFANRSSAAVASSSTQIIDNNNKPVLVKNTTATTRSRLNKIVRTATNLFAGVSSATTTTATRASATATTSTPNMASSNYVVPSTAYAATASIHNTNDNFKNFGDFLVWYV